MAHGQTARSRPKTKLTPRRKPEVERGTSETQGCRRSGAAPCCAAVGTFCPPLAAHTKYFEPRRNISAAETYQPPKPRSRRRLEAPRHQKPKTHKRAETLRDTKTKTPRQSRQAATTEAPMRVLASHAAKYQRPEYCHHQATKQARQHTDHAHPPLKWSEERTERKRSGAAPCCAAC